MTRTTFAVVVALALGSLAGCERGPQERTTAASPASQAGTGASQSNTPSTPANIGQPNQAEKKDGANPVQGQVDPKQGEQHKDFKQSGDGSGPRGPDTQPKTGG